MLWPLFSDRVKETTTTTGTGTYTLAGAVGGFEAFSRLATATRHTIACTDGTDFEVGVGTYGVRHDVARTTILQSSNSDNAVNWGSGTRKIFVRSRQKKLFFLMRVEFLMMC